MFKLHVWPKLSVAAEKANHEIKTLRLIIQVLDKVLLLKFVLSLFAKVN